MKVKVAIVNAFVDGEKGGNPAGVVLDADDLSDAQKQEVARKAGLFETAFVSASGIADFKLEFFTPQRQIAHCGHATIATFSYLSSLGRIVNTDTSKETIDGRRRIYVKGNFAYMEQLAPEYTGLEGETDAILSSLNLSPDLTTTDPVIANTGNSFILLGVKDINTLKSVKPDHRLIEALSERFDLIGFYIFTQQTNQADRDASARMFAPRYGIREESATGMAAGPLACYLFDYLKITKNKFLIEQGYAMPTPSPSCIEVTLTLENAAITTLLAGGTGIVSRYDQIEI